MHRALAIFALKTDSMQSSLYFQDQLTVFKISKKRKNELNHKRGTTNAQDLGKRISEK